MNMSKLFTSVLVAAALVTGAIQPVSARPHDRTISDNNISKKSAPAKQFFEQLQRDSD
jgi:hypothetical protein